jgi:hypothetical protein
MVRRGRRFESVRGLHEVAALQLLFFANATTVEAPWHPPGVHRSPRPLSAGRGIAVADLLCVTLMRRPPSIHGSLNRESIQKRDGVFAAVAGEVVVRRSIIAMLEPMKREAANTETPARTANVA